MGMPGFDSSKVCNVESNFKNNRKSYNNECSYIQNGSLIQSEGNYISSICLCSSVGQSSSFVMRVSQVRILPSALGVLTNTLKFWKSARSCPVVDNVTVRHNLFHKKLSQLSWFRATLLHGEGPRFESQRKYKNKNR